MGHTRGGRAHKCHLSHEDVREGRSRAHRRFWKLRGRRFEWAWALPGAATPSHQKGTSEQAKPRTPGRCGRAERGSGWRQEGQEHPGAPRSSQDAERDGEREVPGADPTPGSDVLRKSHRS